MANIGNPLWALMSKQFLGTRKNVDLEKLTQSLKTAQKRFYKFSVKVCIIHIGTVTQHCHYLRWAQAFNPLQYDIWSAVHDMAGGPAGHPCVDKISESKDGFGGRLHSCHAQPSEPEQYLNCCRDTSEPGGRGLKQLQQSWENFTFLLIDTEHNYLQYSNKIFLYTFFFA